MRLFFVTAFIRFFAWLPVPINHCLGAMLGTIIYRINGRERHITEQNLQCCFANLSAEQRAKIAKGSLQETGKWAFETPAVWLRGKNWRASKVTSVKGRELFEQALADERGVLLIVPHFGNWELAGMWSGEYAAITAMYRTPKMAFLDPLVKKIRGSVANSTLVPATARGVSATLRALKDGGTTMILPDQVPAGAGGAYAEFFGQPAYTQTLVYNLIKKTNPIVLQVYAMRCGSEFEIGFMPPHPDIYDADRQISLQGLNKTIEQLCTLDLTQYQWEYKRFKKQPNGKDFYSKT